MTIGGIGGNMNANAAGAISPNQGTDSYSKSLQKQIAEAQKQLQELGKNSGLDPETKMKKRQELQKQISDLNAQLRQHQVEERRKAAEQKKQKAQPEKGQENMTGLSQNSMKAIISAEGSLRQAKIQGGTAKQMQNAADVKKSEIIRDGGGTKRSSDDSAFISQKWDDVEELEQKAQSALVSQSASLAAADDTMKSAAEAEGSSTQTTKKAEKETGTEPEATAKNKGIPEGMSETEGADTTVIAAEEEVKAAPAQSTEPGSNVDVRV